MWMKMPSLQQALAEAELIEFRHLQGRRYELQPVLLLSCAAIASGARSEQEIADWCAAAGPRWRRWLGMNLERSPSAGTIGRIFRGVDGARLEAAILLWTDQILTSLQSLDRERWYRVRPESGTARLDHSLWMERSELMSALSEQLTSLFDRVMRFLDEAGQLDREMMRKSLLTDLVLIGAVDTDDYRKRHREEILLKRRPVVEPAFPPPLIAPEQNRRVIAH